MGKFLHLLAIAAFVTVEASFADAGSYSDDQYYEYSESSTEEDDCKPKCLKRNEVYDQCYFPCYQGTCDYTPRPELVKCPCVAGCRCIDGYVRNKDGDCIRRKDCFKCTKRNEVYDQCFSPCLQRTCDYDSRLVKCAPPPKPGDPGCVAGCRCADGYIRNRAGACVRREECDSCRGDENAKPGCGVNCGQKCSDIGKKEPTPCPEICSLNGCDCKPGFYYDSIKDKCVRPKDCSPICRANEVYSTCANGGCGKRKCTDLGKPDLCIDPKVCKPGCVCAKGYYRDAKGNCVTEQECINQIGCGGDINAVPGCTCGQKCTDIGKEPIRCPRILCAQGSCKCKNGFYYDEVQKKCVRPSQCTKTPKCKKNEVLSSCANGWCGWRRCTDLNGPMMCSDPIKCEPGCVCADGYYRDNNDNCISKEQCLVKYGCGGDRNAVPGCGVNCGKKCSDVGKKGPFACPEICLLGGCDCKDGFYYDDIQKKCVRPGQCIKPTNGISCANASDFEVHLRQGNYILNGKLLYQIMKSNPKKSVVCSGFATMLPFALLLLYAKDNTYTELLKFLNVQNTDEIRCAFKLFLDSVKAAEGTELDLAAKVYIKDSYQLSEPFKKDAKDIFNAEGESISFDDPNNAAAIINQWVSDATKGKINDLVTADLFDSLTRFVIANAIYFKGTWKTEFDPNDTKKADFYVDSQNTKQVDMMELKAKLNYNTHDDLDASTVELPFKDEDITFVIIVPNQNDGITNLVDKLQDGDTLDRAVSSFRSEIVDLFMPRLDISTSTDLIKALVPIGVKTIFSQNAKLVGTIVPDEDLYVSAAVQKATLILDEKGAEASAANAIVVSQKSLPIPVRADHPFVFGIKVRKTLIFTGIYYG